MRVIAPDARGTGVAGVREAAATGLPGSPQRATLVLRLATFVGERFPLPAYGPLIVALVICGATAAAVASGGQPEIGWPTLGATVAVALAFLVLRILDEVRDADVDRLGRPERPLPRGLVTASELRALAIVAALAAIVVALPLGEAASAVLGLAFFTIWVLGTEQPRRLPIRNGIVGEALLHSIITPELLLFIWLTAGAVGDGVALGACLLLAWGASLGLELARKTVLADEERSGVSTYSGELGRPRALALAALAISAAFVGAGAFALAVGAPAEAAALPAAGAVAVPLATRWFGRSVGTIAIRAMAGILVLAVLLWPVVVMLEIT